MKIILKLTVANNMPKKYIGIVGIAVVIFLVVGFVGYKIKTDRVLGMESYEFPRGYSDVVGTHVATSTVGAAFSVASGGNTVTSTYISKIGSNKDLAIYTIKAVAASSTSNARFEIQGSYDDFCDTTATSGGNLPLTTEINWFSAGDHFKDKVHSTSFTNASSTSYMAWNSLMTSAGNEIILTDLNYECLKLAVSASSTELYVGIKVK